MDNRILFREYISFLISFLISMEFKGYSNTAYTFNFISLQVRVHFLRAVKSKLPEGRYVVMASLFDSLGGPPLHWTRTRQNGQEERFSCVTRAVKHFGGYSDRCMRFEDSCVVLCPPVAHLRYVTFLFY